MELWISFIHSTDIEILMFACSLLDAMSKYKSGPWYNEDGSQKVLQTALCIKGCFKWIILWIFSLVTNSRNEATCWDAIYFKISEKDIFKIGLKDNTQAGFRKGRGTRDQIANMCWIIKKAREFQKNIYFSFIDYAKAFDCVGHNKLWKILKEMGIPDHLTYLLRNLYAGQEATVRTGHGTDWFQIGKGVCQGCILSPCLFNFYAEDIMRNAGLEEE